MVDDEGSLFFRDVPIGNDTVYVSSLVSLDYASKTVIYTEPGIEDDSLVSYEEVRTGRY